MKLQQLRYLREVARQGLNVSEAADALFTSQPGVSKQIRLLEEELGVEVFLRNGKRVVAVTAPGQAILALAERMLQDADNLKRVAREFSNEDEGSLSIATTHTQAKYALPPVVSEFMKRYPKIRLSLHQGTPVEICERVVSGDADIAIATEAIDQYRELVMLPCHHLRLRICRPLAA
jgi:LysR family cys regulon transcriptional activator